jgi:hypothetical protein
MDENWTNQKDDAGEAGEAACKEWEAASGQHRRKIHDNAFPGNVPIVSWRNVVAIAVVRNFAGTFREPSGPFAHHIIAPDGTRVRSRWNP